MTMTMQLHKLGLAVPHGLDPLAQVAVLTHILARGGGVRDDDEDDDDEDEDDYIEDGDDNSVPVGTSLSHMRFSMFLCLSPPPSARRRRRPLSVSRYVCTS